MATRTGPVAAAAGDVAVVGAGDWARAAAGQQAARRSSRNARMRMVPDSISPPCRGAPIERRGGQLRHTLPEPRMPQLRHTLVRFADRWLGRSAWFRRLRWRAPLLTVVR